MKPTKLLTTRQILLLLIATIISACANNTQNDKNYEEFYYDDTYESYDDISEPSYANNNDDGLYEGYDINEPSHTRQTNYASQVQNKPYGIKHFIEPQYGAFSFNYPENYIAYGSYLNDVIAFPVVTLISKDQSRFCFYNDQSSLGYIPLNQVFGGRLGGVYMGCLIVNDINAQAHAQTALMRKGFTNVQLSNYHRESDANQVANHNFEVVCQGGDGKTYKGGIIVMFMPIANTPMVIPYEIAFLTTQNVAEAKSEFEVFINSFKSNAQVVQQLEAIKSRQMQMASAQSSRDVNNYMQIHAQRHNASVQNSQRIADIIGGNTQQYDPYSGQTLKMQDTYDTHYFINPNGQVITNNTGLSPGVDFRPMHENY